jgi:hypothetical protein
VSYQLAQFPLLFNLEGRATIGDQQFGCAGFGLGMR